MSADSASQPENAASRAIAAIAPPYRRRTSTGTSSREQEASNEAAGVDPVLVGDGLGEQAGPAVRLAAGVRHVLGPRPGEAALAGHGLRPAAAGATCPSRHRRRRRTPPRPVAASARSGAAARRAPSSGRPAARRRPPGTAPRRRSPASPRSAYDWTGRRLAAEDDARRGPRSPGRSARRPDASPRRAGSRRAGPATWIRAAVVTAWPVSASRRRGTSRGRRDHLAGRDPDPDLERLADGPGVGQPGPDRERGEARPGARRRRGRAASRRPRTRASPMNFSRVPSNALDRVDHRGERRVDAGADLLGIVLGDAAGRSRRGRRRAR